VFLLFGTGQVLLDISSNFDNAPILLSVTPIAVTAGEKANIVVKGLNLSSSTSKYSISLS
jgi:hypothetical protein